MDINNLHEITTDNNVPHCSAGRSDPVDRSSTAGWIDEVCALLADRGHRYVLYSLAEADESSISCTRLLELANAIQEAGSSADEAGPRISEAELHHKHLPRLETAGVIEYDRREETVRYHETTPLRTWLDHARYTETGTLPNE